MRPRVLRVTIALSLIVPGLVGVTRATAQSTVVTSRLVCSGLMASASIKRGEGTACLSAGRHSVRFAVIGDYGSGDSLEKDVADRVKSWNPDFIATVGDNNYPQGSASTIDRNVGQFYHSYIYPYKGSYGGGATTNRFWPIFGHRDWDNAGVNRTTPLSGKPYLNYFTLPGNKRYYDFARGPVHFFMLDTDPYRERDGTSSTSKQAMWLRRRLAAAKQPWKLVLGHHAPYSSNPSTIYGIHGAGYMRWPFAAWGATAILSGFYHSYERIFRDGIAYFVLGVSGGNDETGFTDPPVAGSQFRNNSDHGAVLVTADRKHITFQFVSRSGETIDSYTIRLPHRLRGSARLAPYTRAVDTRESWRVRPSAGDAPIVRSRQ